MDLIFKAVVVILTAMVVIGDAASVQTVTKAYEDTTPLVEEGVSGEDIEAMINYLVNYAELEKDEPNPSHSSEDGNVGNKNKEDITRRPSFVERVATLQRESGMPVTGIISQRIIAQTKEPRCGMPDKPRDGEGPAEYNTAYKSWESKYDKGTEKYLLSYSLLKRTFPIVNGLSKSDMEKGILMAMCMWEWNSNIRFSKNNGDDNPTADIKISFGRREHGDSFSFDGAGGTLAHAFYPENGGLHFDSEEPWYLARNSKQSYSKKDLFAVGAHELGHNLGLQHSITGALMAPFYKFENSFEDYALPQDDRKGIESLYGNVNSHQDPTSERNSACRMLFTNHGVTHPKSSISGGGGGHVKPTRRTTTTTRRTRSTTSTTTTTTDTTERKDECRDDEDLGKFCQGWKLKNYCTDFSESESMRRTCKKTCGVCSTTPSITRPEVDKGTNKKPENVCGEGRFSSFVTVYDNGRFYDAYAFKDDYYYRLTSEIDIRNAPYDTMLNTTSELKQSFKWLTDPKTFKPGIYKIKRLYSRTKSPNALLITGSWILSFEDSGMVNQYSRYTNPAVPMGDPRKIGEMFEGYHHETVDGVYVETRQGRNKRDTIYTLFRHDKMWQYMEKQLTKKVITSIRDKKENTPEIRFIPIEGRSGIDIFEWHGVSACNIDAVFKYKDVPYFLKGNIFWPATNTEPAVARDISYHFFRCWSETKTYDIPKTCTRMMGRSMQPGNGSTSTYVIASTSLYFVTILLTALFHLRKDVI